MNDLRIVALTVAKATCPEDVFGDVFDDRLVDAVAKARHKLSVEYRRLVAIIHPDRHTGTDAAVASACFGRLGILRQLADDRIGAGTYGSHAPIEPAKPAPPRFEPQVIRAAKAQYTVIEPIAEGDLSTVYRARRADPGHPDCDVAFKLANHPGDNDLLEHESRILPTVRPISSPYEGGWRFLPRLIDTFMLRDASKKMRRVNVIEYADGYVSIDQIMKAYPLGLDFRDVAWIFKRMLYALWFLHDDRNAIHGAVLPPHVLVHPTEHGAKLVDWCYGVNAWPSRAAHIRAISSPYSEFYPREVLRKEPPKPQTDIYMAAKCAVVLLGGHAGTNVMPSTVPARIQGFLRSCLIASEHQRPDDAGALHQEFDELLRNLVGKPTYRPLAMPAK